MRRDYQRLVDILGLMPKSQTISRGWTPMDADKTKTMRIAKGIELPEESCRLVDILDALENKKWAADGRRWTRITQWQAMGHFR